MSLCAHAGTPFTAPSSNRQRVRETAKAPGGTAALTAVVTAHEPGRGAKVGARSGLKAGQVAVGQIPGADVGIEVEPGPGIRRVHPFASPVFGAVICHVRSDIATASEHERQTEMW